MDTLYCQEYGRKNRENHYVSFSLPEYQQRLEKRKKRYERFSKIKENMLTNQKVLTQSEYHLLFLLLCISLPIISYLLFPSIIVSIFILLFPLLWWIARVIRKKIYQYVYQQTDPYHLLRAEQKVNPELLLVDPKLNFYAKLPPLRKEKQKLHLQIDRSDVRLPSLFQLSFRDDILLIAAYIHLLRVNFFFPVNEIAGEIQYKNRKKTKKISFENKKLLKKAVDMLLKEFHSASSRQTKGFPFRCVKCPFRHSCKQVQYYPELKTSNWENEDVDKTYQILNHVKNRLVNTNFSNWRRDVKEFLSLCHSSDLIKNRLLVINQNAQKYDIQQMIESAIIHNVPLANNYLGSKTSGLAFSYQLLLYLEQFGQKRKLEKIIQYYGIYQGRDTKTANNIKLSNFFQLITKSLIMDLDKHLHQYTTPNTPQNQYNNYAEVINISGNNSVINSKAIFIEKD